MTANGPAGARTHTRARVRAKPMNELLVKLDWVSVFLDHCGEDTLEICTGKVHVRLFKEQSTVIVEQEADRDG